MSQMENDFSSTEAKLREIKTAVRKATEEAMKTASTQDALELPFKSLNMDESVLISTGTKENENPNLSSSESFALGMTLFGQDMSVIERSIQDKLTKVENDLVDVRSALQAEEDGEHVSPDTLKAEADNLKKRIEFLQICSKARASLDEATTLSTISTTNEPDYLTAADFLVTARVHLSEADAIVKCEESESESLSNALVGAYRILDSLRSAIRRKCLDLTSKATTLLETSVTITATSISVKGGPSTGLQAAFNILDKLSPSNKQTLHKSVKGMADELVNKVVQPILNDWKNGVSSAWTFSDSSSRHLTCIEWAKEEQEEEVAATDNLLPLKEAFTFLQRILVFFQQKVLLDRDDLSEAFGNYLFSIPTDSIAVRMKALQVESNLLGVYSCSIMKKILDLMLETCIPTGLSVTGLASLKDIAISIQGVTDSFNAEMNRIKFYSDASNQSHIADFISNISQKYVDKRRATILNQARVILLTNDYHNTVEVGEDIVKQPSLIGDGSTEVDGLAVFRLHKCNVSQTATLILGLTRETMDEATSVIPADDDVLNLLPANLYRTAREILDMFRAMIPTTFENEITIVPRTAAVLHNDCVYFAHHCLTLGLEYKEKFPPVAGPEDLRGVALRQTCMFVDMVPIFRELADQAMGDMLEKQYGQIHEVVGSRVTMFGASLKSNESLSEWVDAETAMKAGIYHVTKLSQTWRPVLSVEVHQRSMGFLLDAIFNIFLDQMFLATEISEPASHFVSSVFRIGLHGALELTSNDVSSCLSWDRFSAVGRFMDMSLADISVALSDGVFRAVTGQELSRLIMATFDDSDKRRRLLHALASES